MQVCQYLADFPLFYNSGIKFVGPIISYVICSSTAGSYVTVCIEYKIIFVIEYYLAHPLLFITKINKTFLIGTSAKESNSTLFF